MRRRHIPFEMRTAEGLHIERDAEKIGIRRGERGLKLSGQPIDPKITEEIDRELLEARKLLAKAVLILATVTGSRITVTLESGRVCTGQVFQDLENIDGPNTWRMDTGTIWIPIFYSEVVDAKLVKTE